MMLLEKDTIITHKLTRVQLIFKDETIITLGQNSRFLIEKYFFHDKENCIAHFLLKNGTMRARTGKIGKLSPQSFIVKTDRMNIGVMGTDFTVIIADDGTQKAYCTSGAIKVEFNNQKFEIPKGTYIINNTDNTSKVQDIPQKEYSNILLATPETSSSKESSEIKVEEVDNKINEDTSAIDTSISESILASEDSKQQLVLEEDILKEEEPVVEEDIGKVEEPVVEEQLVQTYLYVGNLTTKSKTTSHTLSITEDGYPINLGNTNITIEDNNGVILKFLPTPPSKSWYTDINHFKLLIDSSSSDSALADGQKMHYATGSIRTNPDSELDDYMTWGDWDIFYKIAEDGVYEENEGYWIAGEHTDSSIIESYKSTNLYGGTYYFSNTNDVSGDGVANLTVDFANDIATLNLLNLQAVDHQLNMSVTGNELHGNQNIGGISKVSDAMFYGPTGNEVGGTFIIDDSSITTNGMFSVKTGTLLK